MFSEERLKHWNSDYHTVNMGDSIAVPFAKYLEKFRDKDVLEIGPGDGRQAVWAWSLVKSYSIADISENVLFDPVFRRDGLHRYLIQLYTDDFKVQFDLIHFWYVLNHILPSELRDFFGFVHRHSRAGGEIMFNTPYLDYPAPAYKDNLDDSLDGVGDVDGDGVPDILIGSIHDDTVGYHAGAAWVVYGPVAGTNDPEEIGTKFLGVTSGDATGFSVAFVRDLDEDGFDDFLVGAYRTAGDKECGTAYLIYGRAR